jgi:hypothetical protein
MSFMKDWQVTFGGALVMFAAGVHVFVGKQYRDCSIVTWGK